MLQGKLKSRKIHSLVGSIKDSELGPYGGGTFTTAKGDSVALRHVMFSQLTPGENQNTVVVGKIVCCIQNEDVVPL